MTLWRELGGGRRGEKPAFLENGFQGGEEHVGRGCQGVGRGRAATSSSPCAAAAGLCLRRSGRRRLGSPVARADRERRADLVLSWPAAREWAERRGVLSRGRPAGRRAWAVLGSRGRAPGGGTPSRRGLSASAPQPLHRGVREAGGRGRLGSTRGGEPCVKAETAALGGGESPWPGAAAASVLRGEIVRLHGSGGSDRDCGLMLRGGDDRLGPVLDPSLILLIAFEQISGNMATEHVNGNGTEEPMDTTSAVIHSENFQTLLDAGLPQKVAEKLDEIYVAGLVAHSDLDERAIEALKEFNEDGALAVLQQFKDSDLSHVQNKSAFLCGVMKTYRQREKQGTKVADSSKGPDESKIKALLERTGYTLDVTTGQRKYGGPPPDSVYSGQQPSVGTEIFVGKIPRDLFEDELVPLFEKAGPIWDLRLMMDPLTGLNRGYAFVTFCTKEAAQEAVKLYNNHEIRSGKHIGVCISVANNRLFVGSIPKSKTKEQILEEFSKVTEGLTDVILYHQPDDKKKNRGFCFLEYEDHKTAAQARRRLMSGKVKVWGNVGTVEWADPIEDPDPEVMAKVKVLFVRNLANTVTEEILEKSFSQFGKLERVKKLKDYAFIHFDERDGAVKAMEEMNGKDLEGENIEIVFAKPPDQKRKERKAQRQAAKNQMYDDYYYYGPPHMPPPTRGRGRGEEGVVEEQGVLLHQEVVGLLLPVVEPVIHREEALDQQEAFVVREEAPNNKEAAGREKGSRPVLTCYNED
ncbi:hypothetical protein NN561_016625 [Cricetulus griseus]